VVMFFLARGIRHRLQHLADRMPHVPPLHMPTVPNWVGTAVRLMRRRAA
jgi:hypothetical protein